MTFWQKLLKIPNIVAIFGIRLYRAVFSPSVGFLRFLSFYPRPTCIFYPTCSEYGIAVFQKYPFLQAFTKTLLRISRCHPHNQPGIDLP